MSDETTFWQSVDKSAGPNGCWQWMGRINPKGYGVTVGMGSPIAHRVAYELLAGPIGVGLQLDHVCHNDSGCRGGDDCPHRRCVNPAHLEPVTGRVNILRSPVAPAAVNARKTECIKGHPFDDANTYINKKGQRGCLICRRATSTAWQNARLAEKRAVKSA